MDRGAWPATVHGVAKSRAWLSDWAHTWPVYQREDNLWDQQVRGYLATPLAQSLDVLTRSRQCRPVGRQMAWHSWEVLNPHQHRKAQQPLCDHMLEKPVHTWGTASKTPNSVCTTIQCLRSKPSHSTWVEDQIKRRRRAAGLIQFIWWGDTYWGTLYLLVKWV